MKNSLHKKIILLIGVLATTISCKKFIEINPPRTELVTDVVFATDGSAKAAIDGIYGRMISSSGFASGGIQSVTVLAGLSSDELLNYSTSDEVNQFYENALVPANTINQSAVWAEPYQYIYSSNAIIEGLSNSLTVSPTVKQQLTGQAKFIRAFCYFYLVNMFGNVPMPLSSDFRANTVANRVPVSQVYDQIVADLKDAKNLLPSDYSLSNNERTKPNSLAATAMLARVYLFLGDWKNAETQATEVIESPLYDLANLNDVFEKNSSEAIWQLMPNEPGFNTNEGRYFILTGAPTLTALTSTQMNSFETGDNRKMDWTDSFANGSDTYYFSYKYKVMSGLNITEYSMVMRLAEQYLIRAESRAYQNNIVGSQSDLNIIRTRAGLKFTSANDQVSLLAAILHERQVELFTEWGHRWFDLKRTDNANTTFAAIKSNWNATDVLYPIPLQEIQNNPHITQNPGY
jgi:starch-binding outer membrane protein, SusD/RagB family